MNWDPVSEHQAGVLCDKGYMKERYDKKVNDLVRTFTPKGISVVKNILKDPNYQKVFLRMIYNEIKDLPKEAQKRVAQEIVDMLNGRSRSKSNRN